jgi:hypothetical protein
MATVKQCDRCPTLVEESSSMPLLERFEGVGLEELGLAAMGNVRIELVVSARQGARADWQKLDLCQRCRYVVEAAFHAATLDRKERPLNAAIRDGLATEKDREERRDG